MFEINKNDQLLKILENKNIKDNDLEFITDAKTKKYVSILNCKVKNNKINIPLKLNSMNDLINNMIEFNPEKRWTLDQCLNHPIFDELKDENKEFDFTTYDS